MDNTLQIYRVNDESEKYNTNKAKLFDLSMRLLIVGKSFLSGKTNLIVNLLLRDEMYRSDFHGENIYIFSGSIKNDNKMKLIIREKQIPKENLFTSFNEDTLDVLYHFIEDNYISSVEDKEKPDNCLIILDDLSYGGQLKNKSNGILAKIFSNGRHINLSIIVTAQKYTDIPTNARENMSGGIFFSCSDKQLELITDDICYISNKKLFKKSFRDVTNIKHGFMVVDFSKPIDKRYLDSNFKPIEF